MLIAVCPVLADTYVWTPISHAHSCSSFRHHVRTCPPASSVTGWRPMSRKYYKSWIDLRIYAKGEADWLVGSLKLYAPGTCSWSILSINCVPVLVFDYASLLLRPPIAVRMGTAGVKRIHANRLHIPWQREQPRYRLIKREQTLSFSNLG